MLYLVAQLLVIGPLPSGLSRSCFQRVETVALTAVHGKKKPADALKAIGIAYLRFAAENPAHQRLMFGPTLQGPDGGLPSKVIRAFGSAVNVLREVLQQGGEDRTFKIPQNDRAALERALIADWALVHGLAMLYIDGLTTLETAQTIDILAEKVVAIFMQGLVKREKDALSPLRKVLTR